MADLFKIGDRGEMKKIEKYAFKDEVDDLEDFIKDNPKILGEVVILGEQVRREGTKTHIIDLLGLDKEEKRVVIIELKNRSADEGDIPQILGYSFSIKSNPDFVQSKIQEYLRKEKDSELTIDSIDMDPKVVLIAPSFNVELIRQCSLINLDIDFVEISRYRGQDNIFVTIDYKEIEEISRGPTKEREIWGWEEYQSKLNYPEKKIKIGQSLVERIDVVVSEENLELKKVFRKGYVNYKYGFFSVFWIDLWSTTDCILACYIDQEPDLAKIGLNPEKFKIKWKKEDNIWEIRIQDPDFDFKKLLSVIKASYKYKVG